VHQTVGRARDTTCRVRETAGRARKTAFAGRSRREHDCGVARRTTWRVLGTVIGIAVATVRGATASNDDDKFPVVLGATVTATSQLTTAKKSYEPWSVLTGAENKFWCEGKPDEGLGESLTIHLSTATQIDKVSIWPGVQRSAELFRANNRVTALDVTTDDGRVFHVAAGDEMKAAEVAIGGAPVTTLTVVIAAVIKGKHNDSCITAVSLTTTPDRPMLVGVDHDSAAALEPALVGLAKAFNGCDAAALGGLVVFPISNHWVDDFGRWHDETFKTATALAEACKHGRVFALFTDGAHIHGGGLSVIGEDFGEVTINQARQVVWKLRLVGGGWKLTSLEWRGQ
jgi:hypothetical protein